MDFIEQKCMQCYVCHSIKVWPVSLGTWCILVHGFSSPHANLRLSALVYFDSRHVVLASEVVRPRFRCIIKLGKCSKRLDKWMGIYIVLMPSVLYWYNFIHHIIWYFISRYNLCSHDVAIWYTLTHVFTRKKSYPSPDWSSWAESFSLGVMKCTVIAVFVYLEKIKLSFQMFPGGTGFMR